MRPHILAEQAERSDGSEAEAEGDNDTQSRGRPAGVALSEEGSTFFVFIFEPKSEPTAADIPTLNQVEIGIDWRQVLGSPRRTSA
jgi:hypothetical protein